MAIIRWRPRREWDPFYDVLAGWRDDINRLFNLSLSRGTKLAPAEALWAPAVDIYEEKGDYIVKAELPGLTKEDIDISVQGSTVTIKGEKKQERESKESGYYCCERSYGRFERSFDLPNEIDASKVKATFKDGVLEVTLPQSEAAKPKQNKVDVK
jgi:HSP20 family protein